MAATRNCWFEGESGTAPPAVPSDPTNEFIRAGETRGLTISECFFSRTAGNLYKAIVLAGPAYGAAIITPAVSQGQGFSGPVAGGEHITILDAQSTVSLFGRETGPAGSPAGLTVFDASFSVERVRPAVLPSNQVLQDPKEGELIYNAQTGTVQVWTGASWSNI